MMPIDKMTDLIHEMENDANRPESMDGLLEMLREKRLELPDDISEEEVDRAVLECVIRSASTQAQARMSRLEKARTLRDTDKAKDLPEDLRAHLEELEADLQEGTDRIADDLEEHMDSRGLHFTSADGPSGSRVYKLGMGLENCTVQMTIAVAHKRIIFTINLPVSVDPVYSLVLGRTLCAINDSIPFGAFVLNERRSALSLDYSFMPGDHLDETVFGLVLTGLCTECDENIDQIRRVAVGKLKTSEKKELIRLTRAMLKDLEEE